MKFNKLIVMFMIVALILSDVLPLKKITYATIYNPDKPVSSDIEKEMNDYINRNKDNAVECEGQYADKSSDAVVYIPTSIFDFSTLEDLGDGNLGYTLYEGGYIIETCTITMTDNSIRSALLERTGSNISHNGENCTELTFKFENINLVASDISKVTIRIKKSGRLYRRRRHI